MVDETFDPSAYLIETVEGEASVLLTSEIPRLTESAVYSETLMILIDAIQRDPPQFTAGEAAKIAMHYDTFSKILDLKAVRDSYDPTVSGAMDISNHWP